MLALYKLVELRWKVAALLISPGDDSQLTTSER